MQEIAPFTGRTSYAKFLLVFRDFPGMNNSRCFPLNSNWDTAVGRRWMLLFKELVLMVPCPALLAGMKWVPTLGFTGRMTPNLWPDPLQRASRKLDVGCWPSELLLHDETCFFNEARSLCSRKLVLGEEERQFNREVSWTWVKLYCQCGCLLRKWCCHYWQNQLCTKIKTLDLS